MPVYVAPFEAASLALKAMIEREVLLINPDDSERSDNTSVPVELSFEVPNSDFVSGLGSKPVIDLYLYRLQEKQSVRYSENYQKLANPNNCKHLIGRRPRFVELFYAVTVWMRSHKNAILTEHNLMSRVLQGIGKYEFVPKTYLEATGFDVDPYGLPIIFFGEDPLRSQSEFWSALGSTPKPMIPLSLTVPVSLHEPIETPVVGGINRSFGGADDDGAGELNASRLVMSGEARDANGEPAVNMVVFVQLRNHPNTVEQALIQGFGCYRFYDLKSGDYDYWVEDNSNPRMPRKTQKSRLRLEEGADGQVLAIERDIEVSF
jgi:Pvc16 N-terminal domain